ncbi:hypothetical protein [Dickeya sp. NCPPB 3274]|uniref:hypothetical protein n=1 Tax=Dickeya sp. NCPPB 3274 TaxID=568766 RepID=UPI0003A6DCC8|nr:hypothetical protein [Dickeya sp. NCPPB 3274]
MEKHFFSLLFKKISTHVEYGSVSAERISDNKEEMTIKLKNGYIKIELINSKTISASLYKWDDEFGYLIENSGSNLDEIADNVIIACNRHH